MNEETIANAIELIDSALESVALLQEETPGFWLYNAIERLLKELRSKLKDNTFSVSDIRSTPLWRLVARELEDVPRPLALRLVAQICEIRSAIDP